MGLLYRLLGLAATINELLGSFSFYYWIRLNWIVLAVVVWHSYHAGEELAEGWPAGAPGVEQILPIVKMILSTTVVVLFVICMTRRNIIFRLAAQPLGNGLKRRDFGDGWRRDVDLRISGKIRRDGDVVSLRDIPVALEVAETGEISLVAWVKVVESLSYFSTGWDRSGRWSIALPRGSLKEALEEGVLYYGLSAMPALHLTGDEKQRDVFLSLPNKNELLVFLATLDKVVAESARKEAIFTTRLIEAASQPTPAEKPASDIKWNDFIDNQVASDPPTAKKPESDVKWNDLIDFST